MVRRRPSNSKATFDVIVVGAGASGVGVGVALSNAGIKKFMIIDRHCIGASFDRWPKEMRFISPSFATNSIGMLDLNSIAIGTSPASSLQVEHPSGKEYAAFLRAVAKHFKLPVRSGIEVLSIEPLASGFELTTNQGKMRARNVIWAAGEFQYPQVAPFPGAELCQHNASIDSWQNFVGKSGLWKQAIVIGGYESGIDAAIHLARLGKNVTVLDRSDPPPWKNDSSDPSCSLSTYTIERLRDPSVINRVKLASGANVVAVRHKGKGYEVQCSTGDLFPSGAPPILATGFRGSIGLVENLFEERKDRYPLLSEHDESTITRGLFLCGPMVRHDDLVFCFIYKFRQRFAVVAKAIADRLGLPAEELETYRQWGMYLDDLSCCGKECVC